ncbi:ATP-binding protein [Actinokineospora fastidiosa]|nr:helicase HerA-like domain-containing protein [Actinokineospora fastidiosa]
MSDDVRAGWDRMVWTRCTAEVDPLWAAEENLSRGGFDDYAAHLRCPFAWIILAEPAPADSVQRELTSLDMSIPRLRQRENSESDRTALERAQIRYRELSRGRVSGMWQVHVLAGGATPSEAARAAALLCGSSDLDRLPYTLHPGSDFTGLGVAWDARVEGDGPASPFMASTELVAALARPPRRELPGIRLTERVGFDQTPEWEGGIPVGHVLDDADLPVGEFTVAPGTLNRHTFVAGATGAGKSQTVRHLLEQLTRAGVPWLVIEPAKAEYARMAGRIGAENLSVIRPGAPDAVPLGINPLEPEPGFPVQTHIDLIRALFLAAFEADEPFPQILSHALSRCYTELGWDTVVGAPVRPDRTPRYPTLSDLRRTAMEVVEGIGYGREIADNVRGFIDVRLSSLRMGTPGRFFEGGHPLDLADLLNRNVVLEIEDIGNDQDKAFLIGAMLIRLHEHLRVHRPDTGTLRHVTVIEEAHRLLKRVEPGSPAAHAVELFSSLLAEIRAYGEGIVVAEQIPAKIVPDIIKNTALKIIHRLPAADDRDTVGSTMNLSEAQSRHVVSLPPGRAVIFSDGMDRPVRVEIPLGEDREAPAEGPSVGRSRTRGAGCGLACRTQGACSLREINTAERVASGPRLVLWTELVVIAHVTGHPTPRPDKRWLDELATLNRRTLECAIGHRVEKSVASRYTGLSEHYQPERLIGHVAATMLMAIDGHRTFCNGTEHEWQSGAYRWIDVIRTLQNDQPVHLPTLATRGLNLPDAPKEVQLNALENHPDVWRPPAGTVIGDTAWKTALAALTQSPDTTSGFRNATQYLRLPTNWAEFLLSIDKTT